MAIFAFGQRQPAPERQGLPYLHLCRSGEHGLRPGRSIGSGGEAGKTAEDKRTSSNRYNSCDRSCITTFGRAHEHSCFARDQLSNIAAKSSSIGFVSPVKG